MSRHGNCTHCFKPWHDGMTCDYAAGYRCALRDESDAIQKARAEIVAKLRERADWFESELSEERGAIEFRIAAQWVEDGCP